MKKADILISIFMMTLAGCSGKNKTAEIPWKTDCMAGESDSLIICRRNCRTVERKVRGSENGR